MRIAFSASLEIPGASRRVRAAAITAFACAALVAIASLGGLLVPALYARETAAWRAQGLRQDAANLVLAVPALVASAALALRGSRRARIVLAGALGYTAYTYVLYAFAVHVNALFLVYCGALGTAVYAAIAIAPSLRDAAAWFEPRAPRHVAGALAIGTGGGFAVLWLAQIVPALVAGTAPAGLDATGLPANPVHVLDLALVLPAMIAGGWLLWRGRPLGYALAPPLLAFLVLMAAALVAFGGITAVLFATLAALGLATLAGLLAAMRR